MRIMAPGPSNPDFHHYFLQQTRQLAARLERLSADSSCARRASGVRGALLRALEKLETGAIPPDLPDLLQAGFTLLVQAARQIEADDT